MRQLHLKHLGHLLRNRHPPLHLPNPKGTLGLRVRALGLHLKHLGQLWHNKPRPPFHSQWQFPHLKG